MGEFKGPELHELANKEISRKAEYLFKLIDDSDFSLENRALMKFEIEKNIHEIKDKAKLNQKLEQIENEFDMLMNYKTILAYQLDARNLYDGAGIDDSALEVLKKQLETCKQRICEILNIKKCV